MTMVATQAAGVPTGNHGLFHRLNRVTSYSFDIDSDFRCRCVFFQFSTGEIYGYFIDSVLKLSPWKDLKKLAVEGRPIFHKSAESLKASFDR